MRLRLAQPHFTPWSGLLGALLLASLSPSARAVPVAFTDRPLFDTAVSALPGVSVSTETFDSTAAGTLIADSGALNGITYSYPTLAGSGVTLQVTTGAQTTSPAHALGTDDGGVLQGGDVVSLAFTPLHAFGLYVIVDVGLGPLVDGDLTLTAGGVTASLNTLAPQTALALGANLEVYFLGLADATAPFSTATLAGSGPFFTFTLDDLVSARPSAAVPEPGSLLLVLTGMGGVLGLTLARHRAASATGAPRGATSATPAHTHNRRSKKMGKTFLGISLVILSLEALLASPVAAQRVSLEALQAQVNALATQVTTLSTQNAALQAANTALTARVGTLEGQTTTLEAQVTTLEAQNAVLESLLTHVSRSGNDLFITGANLHVVNGLGTTQTRNGLGNVIIGYNELRGDGTDDRSGSHMLVVGARQSYSSYGGIVVGQLQTTSGAFSSVSGGVGNTASGAFSSVSGGVGNTASGAFASVSGGQSNTASGANASVSGGQSNTASGSRASVSGGLNRSAADVLDWRAGSLFQEE